MKILRNFLLLFAGVLFVASCERDSDMPPKPAKPVFNETFGTPPTVSPFPSVADFAAANGFVTTGAGSGAVTYSSEGGTVSVRANSASNYTGASGAGNAMLASGGAGLIVSNIATCGATNLLLSFGTNETDAALSVYYRISGTTEWIQIPFAKTTQSWGLLRYLPFSLPAGTNTLNLKFLAATTTYGTRIDDINLSTYDAIGAPVVDPDDGGGAGGGSGTGDGTQASPYNIVAAQAHQTSEVAWIQGYIVGCVKNGFSSISSSADVWIGVTSGWDLETNVLLADDPNETDYTKCVVVNLPPGKDLRTQVNLLNNPGNYQKQLSVTGTLRTYFGIPGLRDSGGTTADFVLQ